MWGDRQCIGTKAIYVLYLQTDNAVVSLSDLFFIADSSLTKVTAVPIEGRVSENCSK